MYSLGIQNKADATLKKMTLVHGRGDKPFVFSRPKPLATLALEVQTKRETKNTKHGTKSMVLHPNIVEEYAESHSN